MDGLALKLISDVPLLGVLLAAMYIIWRRVDQILARLVRLETKMDFVLGKYKAGHNDHAATP